jgi:hypothetical protein
LPQLLLPYVYGTIFGCADQKQTLTTVWAHVGGYLSTSLLLLAVLGLLSRGRRGLRLALLVWIVLALARMYGLPLLGDMLGVVPGISDVLFYRYAFASVELSVIILAALAVDDLVRAPMPRRRLAVGALAAFALVAAAAIGARPLANQLGPVFGDRPYYEAAVAWGAIVVLAAVVAALLRDARARAGTVILLVAVDAMVLFAIPQLSAPRNVRLDRAPVAFLERGRISATRASSPWGPFQPNDGSYFGVASLNINDVPVPSVFTDYVRTRLDSVADPKLLVGNYGGGRPLFAPSPQQELIRNLEGYRAAGVRYVLAPPNAPLPTSGSTFTLVFRSPSTWIYRLSGSVLLHGEGMHREARRARVRTAHLSRPNDARAARGRLPGLERACRRRISAGAPGRRPVPGGAGRRPAPTGSNSATCRQRPSGDSSHSRRVARGC